MCVHTNSSHFGMPTMRAAASPNKLLLLLLLLLLLMVSTRSLRLWCEKYAFVFITRPGTVLVLLFIFGQGKIERLPDNVYKMQQCVYNNNNNKKRVVRKTEKETKTQRGGL